ncbi:CRISPR-associated endonuclease Csn1 [Flavobacterium omnivorum]|uniref:CRISPR-associated endonuclease Cas9 n=1 Tax=Flavobacterium omnivorum TaxID=178355 RepID=A0A1G8ESE5_9FLAO|nr:type II CRISPR RNA-guided endonuclease Cas9 [Flavobacterium omnivorum]SDH72818.1 CRISPR-associated endonuclease Csn1 [Flavobacterium omnivorum]
MAKILGLDLGTNSIGWAIVDKDGSEFSLVDKGVRIFSEGVKSEKGIESSRAAERTGFRSARKIKFRRKLRKYETLKVLSENNMCPLSVEEVIEWRKSGFKKYPLNPEFIAWLRTDDDKNINPYYFRDKSSKQKASLLEVGRAFYHIAQRRGFLSNRLDPSAEGVIEQHKPDLEDIIENASTITELQIELTDYFQNRDLIERKAIDLDEGEKKLKTLYNSFLKTIKDYHKDFDKTKSLLTERLNKKDDLGVVKQKIGEISQAMKDGNFKTLGQYFYSIYNKGKIRNQYTAREEHYLSEFEVICLAQGIDGILTSEKLPEKRYLGLAKELYRAIFFQRPLKSQKGLIGKCTFEKSKSRCAISHPDFEVYRMWCFINTIKIKTPDDESLRFLTNEERLKIIPKFLRKKDNFNFEDLAKELVPSGSKYAFYKSSTAASVNYLFNYSLNSSVSGCVVSTSFKNALGEDWKTKIYSYETLNKNGESVTRNVDYTDLWHLISVSTSDLYLEEFAKDKLKLDAKKAVLFSKTKLKKDFASLSLTAINKINPFLREGLLYSHAVFMANIENIVDVDIWKNLDDRKYIQTKIAELIATNTFDNNLLEIINGLIKECKVGGCYYSKEAEGSYKLDLEKKVNSYVKSNKIEDQKEIIIGLLFPIFIEQLKKYEFIAIKRLDEKVFDFLDGQNDDGQVFCNSKNKLKKLYHPSDIDVFRKQIAKDGNGNEKLVLGSPLISSIKNPMAMRALHQLRKVLNALIVEGQVDEKTRIHIEMARELNDANKRKGIQDFQRDIEKNRKDYIEEIKKDYKAAKGIDIEPTEDDVLRYQLWIEQDKKTIYEEQCTNIGISQIIGIDPDYDIEHTIPRSRSQDNSQMNKTLCSKRYNREIKKNKMPIELSNHRDILDRVEPWRKKYLVLEYDIIVISRAIKAATTREQKDRKIRLRHKLNLEKEYFKGKYERFTYKEPKVGFKNSQIPDTGIITKYASAYLKSYFGRVEAVKGGIVAEFRKAWGIQESYIKDGKKYYQVKDRSKHTHHCIDAITIACMTKDKYDVMAHAWDLEDDLDKNQYKLMKSVLEQSKPWKTFTEDLKKIEDEILVSHNTPDNVKKQSKKIIRVRGKKQFVAEMETDINGKNSPRKDSNNKIIFKKNLNGENTARFHQGDTIRGSLHQDSIYGAIKQPEIDDNTNKPKHTTKGAFVIKKDEKGIDEINFVIRKALSKLSENDIKNIIDPIVCQKIQRAVIDGMITFKTVQGKKVAVVKEGTTIWMREPNKEKDLVGIPINKVRIFTGLKNPLEIKEHSTLSKSRFEHKQKVYAQNDENFAMAIYEGIDKKGNVKRSFESVNYMDAGNYFKLSNRNNNANSLVPLIHLKTQLPLKYEVKKGDLVLFYKENKEELNEISNKDLTKRLYKVIAFEGDGRIQFRYHKTAMQQSSSNKEELTIVKFMADNNLKNSQVDFENPVPWLRLRVSNCNFLLIKKEFEITPTGRIDIL